MKRPPPPPPPTEPYDVRDPVEDVLWAIVAAAYVTAEGFLLYILVRLIFTGSLP